eukprot:scaffold12163_cov176-Amphora_coffeaeformis.AAC.2
MCCLHKQLRSWLSQLDDSEHEWLRTEIELINSGKLSNKELVGNIKGSLNKITRRSDRAEVKYLLTWYKRTSVEEFISRFELVFSGLSLETQQILVDTNKTLIEDLESTDDRIDAIRLSAVNPRLREELYSRKRHLFSRARPSEFEQSRGPSMEPTLWNPSKVWREPLHPTPDKVLLRKMGTWCPLFTFSPTEMQDFLVSVWWVYEVMRCKHGGAKP